MRCLTREALLALLLVAGAPAAATDPEAETRAEDREEAAQDAKSPGAPSTEISPYLRAVSPRSSAKAEDKVVFSNEDLERRFGPPPKVAIEVPDSSAEGAGEAPAAADAEAVEAAEAAEAEPAAPDPAPAEAERDALQLMADEKVAAAERSVQRSEAEAKVEEARRRITELERRVLALRNPLLARPAPPKEQREEWDRADTGARVERSQDELARARDELAAAEQELARLRGAP